MRQRHPARTLGLALLFPLLLAACQAVPPHTASAGPAGPATVPAALPSAPRYLVDPHASEIRMLVYRAGPLAHFGHNHVIVGRVQGEIRAGESAAASGFRLEIPAASFEVDPPAARAEEGPDFAEPVSPQARAATRANMLGSAVLDAARYPFIRVESQSLLGPGWDPSVTARVTLRGATHELHFPAAVVRSDGTLTVIADFPVLQSDFGIVPYSILGGGLRVRDALEVRIRIVAHPA